LFQSSSSSSNPSTLTQHAFHEIDGKLVGFNLVINMTAGISPPQKNSYCSVVLLPMTRIFYVHLQLVVLAAFVAYVSAQSGYAAPAYSPPAYAADYKPGYANGRVKMQV
jgi:hypothetical protein